MSTEEFDLFRKYRQGLYIHVKEYTVAHLTNKDNHLRPWEYSKQAIIPEVIESVICNIPLKPVILQDEYSVVFGHGILATLNWFVEGKAVQTRFRDTPLLFSDLCPTDQRRFLNYSIRSLNVEFKNEKGEEMLDLLLKNWRGFWIGND